MPAGPDQIPAWSTTAPDFPGLKARELHFWRVPLDAAATPGLVDRHRNGITHGLRRVFRPAASLTPKTTGLMTEFAAQEKFPLDSL